MYVRQFYLMKNGVWCAEMCQVTRKKRMKFVSNPIFESCRVSTWPLDKRVEQKLASFPSNVAYTSNNGQDT